MTDNLQLTHLVDACRWIGAKGWAPATGGNMSVRQDEHLCWLSESGKDKGSLTTADFLQVEIATNRAPSGRKPSAETGPHADLSPVPGSQRRPARSYRQRHGAVASGQRSRAQHQRL
jgi:ribulose-5-phosphate 4-epimerase/fuculose-1-phosphate aldolase